jgi:hypothetical protein
MEISRLIFYWEIIFDEHPDETARRREGEREGNNLYSSIVTTNRESTEYVFLREFQKLFN